MTGLMDLSVLSEWLSDVWGKERTMNIHVYIYIHTYIYIYTYIEMKFPFLFAEIR